MLSPYFSSKKGIFALKKLNIGPFQRPKSAIICSISTTSRGPTPGNTIQEGDSHSDNILRVVTSQGGYRLEADAFPIEGPFEISSDEFNEMAKMDEDEDDVEGLLDLSEDQLEMVEAGCEPEIPYFRYQMDVRAEGPVFSEDKDELTAMLIDDVMDLVDCQFWDEMKDSELEDWYTWSTYADD